MKIKKIILDEPVVLYDIGVNSEEHLYTLGCGVVVSNSWSNPADMVRCFAMSGFWKKVERLNSNKTRRKVREPSGYSV